MLPLGAAVLGTKVAGVAGQAASVPVSGGGGFLNGISKMFTGFLGGAGGLAGGAVEGLGGMFGPEMIGENPLGGAMGGGFSLATSSSATSSADVTNTFTTGPMNVGAGAGSNNMIGVILLAVVFIVYVIFANKKK